MSVGGTRPDPKIKAASDHMADVKPGADGLRADQGTLLGLDAGAVTLRPPRIAPAEVAPAPPMPAITPAKPAVTSAFRWIEERVDQGRRRPVLTTGMQSVDHRDRGFQSGELTLAVSASRAVLHALATTIARHASMDRAAPTLLLAMERQGARAAIRFLVTRSGIKQPRVSRARWLSENEWLELIRAADGVAVAPLHLDETPYGTVAALREQIEEVVRLHEIALVIVEGLNGLVADEGRPLAEVCATLIGVARETKVAILAWAHLPNARLVGMRSRTRTCPAADALARHVDGLWVLEQRGREGEMAVMKGPTGQYVVDLEFDASVDSLRERTAETESVDPTKNDPVPF